MKTTGSGEATITTRQRILREAEDLFALRGFEGTGIEEIAQKVGIRKSVIYYHFRNKEQILQTMLDDFLARGVAFKKDLFKRYTGEFMDRLEQVMDEVIGFMEANRRIVTILVMESIKNPRHVPLLELWSFRSPAAREVVASAEAHNIETAKTVQGLESDMTGMVEAFFMLSFPMIGYAVFSDRWCEHNGYDKQRSRKDFIDAYLWYFRERTLKRGT
jgi:AcrR family transcriptional regulator